MATVSSIVLVFYVDVSVDVWLWDNDGTWLLWHWCEWSAGTQTRMQKACFCFIIICFSRGPNMLWKSWLLFLMHVSNTAAVLHVFFLTCDAHVNASNPHMTVDRFRWKSLNRQCSHTHYYSSAFNCVLRMWSVEVMATHRWTIAPY